MLRDTVLAREVLSERPHDVVFERWAAEELTWLPAQGMGRLTLEGAPYDTAYFRKYEGYAATELGRALTAARVALVARNYTGTLIDVGIGCGAFVQARANTFGYDVNPAGIDWLVVHDLWRSPYMDGGVEAVSLWDVLEHIAVPARLLANVRSWVFVSLPVVPGDGPPPPGEWKHLRRDEHCWYWNQRGLIAWMRLQGFRLVEYSDMETRLGREDIGSFAFRRIGL